MARKFNEDKPGFTEFIIINAAKFFSDRIKVNLS
jgi:hypothetical protein